MSWHKAQIKAQVEMLGTNLSALALRNGLNEAACRIALIRRNKKAEEAIAACIGVPLWELWPDRWTRSECGTKALRIDGRRRKHRRNCNHSIRHGRAGHCQIAERL